MIWLFFASMAAFFEGLRATFAKKVMTQATQADEYLITWTQRAFAIPIGIWLIYNNPSNITFRFMLVIITGFMLVGIASTLYMRAIKISPLYLTMPYLALTPLFLLVTSRFIVGEAPDLSGYFGIVLIVIGVYLLHAKKAHRKWWEPIAAIKNELGSVLMIIVAIIFSIGANLDKVAVKETNPFFYVGFSTISFSVFYLPFMMKLSKKPFQKMKENWKGILLVATLSIFVLLFQMSAINIALVSYVISIKRMSILIGVILGAIMYKEKGLGIHLAAAGMMVAGAILIAV